MQSYEREIVGHILANVFAEKYEPAFGTDMELAAEVASIVPLSGATYLALLDFQAAGTATLHTNGATGFGGYETQLMWRMVRKRLGFFGAIRAFIKLSGGVSSLDTSASYVSSVAVLPEFQRMGVATALLQRMEDDARTAGKLRIGLHVLETNSVARRLYERLGYTVEKKVTPTHMPWRRNVPVHLYMVKQLPWNRGQNWAQQ